MTKIIKDIDPPVYKKYRERFGAANVDWKHGLMIAYAGAIYTKIEPTEDEIAHEETHLRQQDRIGLDLWVEQYINDEKFRFDMELEAYQAQARYMRENDYRRKDRVVRIKEMAKLLSSGMYGSIINFSDALNLLK